MIGIELFIKCYPTDSNAKHYPNSNFAVKPISITYVLEMYQQSKNNSGEQKEDWISVKDKFVFTKEELQKVLADCVYKLMSEGMNINTYMELISTPTPLTDSVNNVTNPLKH